MQVLWWRKKPRELDAAARRVLRSNLAEIDYDLRRISWDVDSVSTPATRGTSPAMSRSKE
ncbi:MAG: hypothetical protein ABL907_18315 [Hyphomicrobium sp.]